MRGLAGVLLVLALGAPVAAASPSDALKAAGAEVAGAVAALDAPGDVEERVAALGRAISAYETSLVGLRGAVFGAEDRERRVTLDLAERRAEIARLLAALQTLSRTPQPVQALHPAGPVGAARAAAMLSGLTPALQARAEALAAQLAEIEEARDLRARGLEDMQRGLTQLTEARTALLAAMDRRAPADLEAAVSVPASLARDAETLSALSDRLAALGPGAAAQTEPMALRWPVAGRVLRGFREPDAAGVRRPGLVVEAAPLALVTSPAEATVRYAGPFLDYGYVVVLSPRADVLVVLAGLATLETRTGAVLREGAVLGLLGGRNLDAQEYLMLGGAGTGETPPETLYIEVRHGQGPVDPASWFSDRNG